MKKPTYYPDGYTRRGRIKESADLGEVNFTYRPMLPEERDPVREAMQKRPAEQAIKILEAAVAKHLVTWDVTHPKTGAEIVISYESVRHLPPQLLDQIYLIIAGTIPSDPLEGETTEENDDYATSLLKAAANGTTPGGEAERAAMGNSTGA